MEFSSPSENFEILKILNFLNFDFNFENAVA